ncbi:MAG: TlyA family RNA methyltransferase [Clostridiales bacterium]|nr:TlyA family RNA methyltransferase [Clostridiales bacterium]
MTQKMRLDAALVEQGLAPGRDRAKAVIMAGTVYVNGQKCDKPGTQVKPGDALEVRGPSLAYVSRGGLKLEKALAAFPIDLRDAVCLDVGASTGGFTDCMLQNGARRVYAVDVGYGQLAWKLRTDDRVVNLERTNFRHLKPEALEDMMDFASVDVSFISLRIILPVLAGFLRTQGQAVCLVKPQFEAGRGKVGKKGVVREAETHLEVLEQRIQAALEAGFSVRGLDYSPVKGPQGNVEFLMYLEKAGEPVCAAGVDCGAVVAAAHEQLLME